MATIVLASNLLGMGGTEKGMSIQALALDRERFDVRILGVLGSGPRRELLEAAGLRVDVGDGDRERLTALLRDSDVVLHLRQGNTEPLLPAACRDAGVPFIVDWNIFGQVDHSDDEPGFACHLFISQMIATRYRRRISDPGPGFHARHRVHYLPIDPALRAGAPDRREARRRLGLDPDRPVVGRVGRAVDLKWRNLLVDMIPHLRRDVPDVQLLLVGATAAKEERLRRLGVLDCATLLEPTLDDERLAAYYAACDVFISAAEIGESQGLSNLEAMSLGVPVVTCSTPWADNAQVEFVEHDVTGLVANHARPFAEAVGKLLRDPQLRERLGTAARSAIDRRFDPAVQARQLERLFDALLAHGHAPAEWSPSARELDGFGTEYRRRARLEYRRLRPREHVEAQATRVRERAAQYAMHLNRRALGDKLRSLRGRVT